MKLVSESPSQPRVLLLTGTCGSGKTTVAARLASRHGWVHVSEDEIWPRLFGKDRGAFGSAEYREKRRQVHEVAFAHIREALGAGLDVVVDATVHEAPPEALHEYRAWFAAHGIAWTIRVLYPRLEVAVARDAHRTSWTVGPASVASLHAKFTGAQIGSECFLDTSDETPEETMERLLAAWR
jgi:predicted kinase